MASPKSANPRAAVSFDPETVLVGDVGLLLNPHFAKALYEELRAARGPSMLILFRINILVWSMLTHYKHGLRQQCCENNSILGLRV